MLAHCVLYGVKENCEREIREKRKMCSCFAPVVMLVYVIMLHHGIKRNF